MTDNKEFTEHTDLTALTAGMSVEEIGRLMQEGLDMQEIRQILRTLPYSGLVPHREVVGLHGLAAWLADFGDVLQRHAAQADAAEAELTALKRDLAGVGRLLAHVLPVSRTPEPPRGGPGDSEESADPETTHCC